MAVRPIKATERFHIGANLMVQLAMELESPAYVREAVEALQRGVIGLRLKTDGSNMIARPLDDRVFQLPASLDSARHAASHMAKHHTLPLSDCLASIGCNDRFVVLNCNHSCADGGFLLHILKHWRDGTGLDVQFPTTADDLFPEIARMKGPFQWDIGVSKVAGIKDEVTGMQGDDRVLADHVTSITPAKELQCYKNGKCVGLTETLWASLSLAVNTSAGKWSEFGVKTCYDLRRMTNPADVKWGLCNHFSGLAVAPKNVNMEMTLDEFGREFREAFKEQVKKRTPLDFIGWLGAARPVKFGPPGVSGPTAEVTNVGPVRIERPVKDIWMQQTMKSTWTEGTLSLLSYSIIDGMERNDVVTRLRFSPTSVRRERVEEILRAVLHIARNVPASEPISAVVKEITPFFKK